MFFSLPDPFPAPSLVTRRHHAAVLLGSRLYVIGGYGKHRVVLASVESLDLDTGEVLCLLCT